MGGGYNNTVALAKESSLLALPEAQQIHVACHSSRLSHEAVDQAGSRDDGGGGHVNLL